MVAWVRADTTSCHLLLNTWGEQEEEGIGRRGGYLPAPLLDGVEVLPAPRQPHVPLVPDIPQGGREGAGHGGVLTGRKYRAQETWISNYIIQCTEVARFKTGMPV